MFPFDDGRHNGTCDVQVFHASTIWGASSAPSFQAWRKRPGAAMVSIFAIGAGGGGGTGAVGVSGSGTGSGGAGGGSGAQVYFVGPACFIPDTLYVSPGIGAPGGQGSSGGSGGVTYVNVFPDKNSVNGLVVALNGSGGTNGASGTGAGGAGPVSSLSSWMSMGGRGSFTPLAGQAGATGVTTTLGNSISVPTTGLMVTGGAGGGGVPAAGVAGTNGGGITGSGSLQTQAGGLGGTGTTTPPTIGSHGYNALPYTQFGFFYGGCGGGSTHGSATGAGLVGANGGDGAIGCGGGGGGGALTGSTAGVGGRGGDGLVVIVQW